jgi:hypothetical protein
VFNGIDVMNENACRGPQAAASKVIRASFGSGNVGGVGTELDAALNAALAANPLHDQAWFCGQLLQTPLYRWNPANNLATSPLNPQGLGPHSERTPDRIGRGSVRTRISKARARITRPAGYAVLAYKLSQT